MQEPSVGCRRLCQIRDVSELQLFLISSSREDTFLAFLQNATEYLDAGGDILRDLEKDLDTLSILLQQGTKQAGNTRFVNGNITGSIAVSAGDIAYTKLVASVADKLEIYFRLVFS